MRQALRNLIANAVDCQPDGGRIHVGFHASAGEACCEVSDAGPGIRAELRDKVCEPFFTTRPDGTGLGLAIVHTIVKLHGGRLEIAPAPSFLGGALVRIRLPLGSQS
jgi:signal transduction histidine kinase